MAARQNYQIGWQGDADSFKNAKNYGLTKLGLALWRVQRSQGGPYDLKERGHHTEYGKERKWRDHWRRLRVLLQKSDIGTTYFSRGEQGRTAAVRVVKVIRKSSGSGGGGTTPSTGTPDVKRVYQEVTARFNVTSLGICNCRKIDGSSSWSEHSWCDAWDIHGSVSELDKVNHYLLSNKARLNINNVLWHYPNHYPDHIHVDFQPSHSGQTPPCA